MGKQGEMREEKDSLGTKEVPAEAYYGIHTCRSLENFPLSGIQVPKEIIYAMARLKAACAAANNELGLLDDRKTEAIVKATEVILEGTLDDQFPIDIFQAGSGTSTNMNVNEVIANRAIEFLGGKKGERTLLHPNDDVNKGQSTNNVFPSSIRVALVMMLPELTDALQRYISVLHIKGDQYDHVLKSGRTHLQDAVPVRLGQVFHAFAYSAEKHLKRLREAGDYLKELGIGGNAVGTGINTKESFRELIVSAFNKKWRTDFRVTGDGVEATHSTTDIAHFSASLRSLAVDVGRVCNDLRLMSSGPNTGLNEINLPAVEPGSSIMPGKINPSICEAVNMLCFRVMGNDTTVASSASAAQLELNVTMPVTGYCVVESVRLLGNALDVLREKCIEGISVNEEVCRNYAEQSPSLATFLNPLVGYDKASQVVKDAIKNKRTIPEEVKAQGLLPEEEMKHIFDPHRLTSPEKG